MPARRPDCLSYFSNPRGRPSRKLPVLLLGGAEPPPSVFDARAVIPKRRGISKMTTPQPRQKVLHVPLEYIWHDFSRVRWSPAIATMRKHARADALPVTLDRAAPCRPHRLPLEDE